MVAHGRVELLAHPLSQKYLQMKWNSYGKYFHLANLLFYSIFLFFTTIFTSTLMTEPKMNPKNSTAIIVSGSIIFIYIVGSSLREIVQAYQKKWHYLLEPINFVSWLLYISSAIMLTSMFHSEISEIHYTSSAITVFLSWFNLLLFLQRFDQVGIYVVMFLEILQTLIKVLLVFSILIIAFGLAFFILLPKDKTIVPDSLIPTLSSEQPTESSAFYSFSSIPLALLRTFSMMLGELDFVSTYAKPYHENKDRSLSALIVLCLFMILMPILLMNLLIGLAVGDIESVRRNAQLKRLAMQVVLHTELERKLPQMWLEKVDKMELIEYPNNKKCKLGFLDSLCRKWFYNPFSDDGKSGIDLIMETNDDFMVGEIDKQKRKLRDISTVLEQQHQLLRLIVQVSRLVCVNTIINFIV